MQRLPFVVDPGAACLDGHFPGRPLVPGVALIDAALAAFGLSGPLRVDQAKFLRPCLPGVALELVRIERPGAVELRVECQGELMASARVRLLAAADGPDRG